MSDGHQQCFSANRQCSNCIENIGSVWLHILMLSLQYVAGFFDGEGNISLGGSNKKAIRKNSLGRTRIIDHIMWVRRVSIANTKLTILQQIQKQFGGTIYKHGHKPSLDWEQGWRWNVHGGQSTRFLKKILPYLVIKRPQADVFLEFAETVRRPGQHSLPYDVIKKRHELYTRLRSLNAKGNRAPTVGAIQLPSPNVNNIDCEHCGKSREITPGVLQWHRARSPKRLRLCFDCFREARRKARRNKLGHFIYDSRP